jgi:hypothetical protein
MITVIEHPSQHMRLIENDIVMNEKIITDDISSALEAFRAGEFKYFGQKIGETLMLAS